MDRSAENRLRFSVVHEIGHLILHGDLYRGLRHANVEAGKQFINDISSVPLTRRSRSV